MRFLLVSERSGGHVYPALVIADKIKEKKSKTSNIFFFTSSSIFKNYIKNKGYSRLGIIFKSRNIVIELLVRFIESLYILFKVRPDYVIGFGGRDSIFLILFSRFFTNNIYIYEPNAKMGKANRFLACFVKIILRGIPPLDKSRKQKLIGVPLNKNIVRLDKKKIKKTLGFNEKPIVFCFGGSQGSNFINNIFFNFIQNHNQVSYQIIHITGKKDYQRMLQFYKKIKNNKIINDFCQDMAIFYNIADLIISRAGAITLGEISFYNIPSIIIPHPGAGGHQNANACYLVKKKAAFVLDQNNFDFSKFENYLQTMISDVNLRSSMKHNWQKINFEVNYEEFSFDFIN